VISVVPELEHEREYLARARTELTRMRKQTLSLEAHGGDRGSSELLAATLYRRAQSLIDDPTTSLFFGRIDQDPGGGEHPERWYIGRRHVADSHGDPVVIDWRADVSTAFYRASRAEPMGVSLRRRFGIDHGQLTAFEDERLDRGELEVADLHRIGTPGQREQAVDVRRAAQENEPSTELTSGANTRTPRFYAILGPSNRWYVDNMAIAAVRDFCIK